MKKITLLAVVLIAASFASCKKTHTCTCSDTGSTGSFTYTQGKQTKKNAQATCDSYETVWDNCTLN